MNIPAGCHIDVPIGNVVPACSVMCELALDVDWCLVEASADVFRSLND